MVDRRESVRLAVQEVGTAARCCGATWHCGELVLPRVVMAAGCCAASFAPPRLAGLVCRCVWPFFRSAGAPRGKSLPAYSGVPCGCRQSFLIVMGQLG
jgi:hypothetical protein